MKLKLAYFGTPNFAADLLKKIITDKELPVEVELIVTQPDKKVGRKQILTPTPVKILGYEYGIEIFNDLLKEEDIKNKLKDIDVGVVYAYGKIIPEEILNIPRLGFWNIHPSLLPKYRGPSPIAYPLLMNEKETGVSLMLMDKEMDHGNIIKQQTYQIDSQTYRPILEKELTELGYSLLKDSILKVSINNVKIVSELSSIQQNHAQATYTRKLSKEDGFIPIKVLQSVIKGESIDWKPQILENYFEKNSSPSMKNSAFVQNSSLMIFNLFRALYPWPGIWTKVRVNGHELRLKITDVHLSTENILTLRKVQLEGKNEVEFKVFNKAYKIFNL